MSNLRPADGQAKTTTSETPAPESLPNGALNASSRAISGSSPATRSGPLAGIRVIELATVVMGPYAGQQFGDLGADVVKVEPPEGDSSRYINPGPHPDLSGTALNLHRNKRSVVLNLKRPAAREALLKLIDTADVLVTNYRPSALRRFGLRYEDLEARAPRLVYCEAHGFRSDGPEADDPAFDDTIQSLTGTATMLEDLGIEKRFLPFVIADKVTATAIVSGVLAGLYEREKSGRGQRIEVPMFNTLLAFNLTEHLARAAVPGGEVGHIRIQTLNRGPYQTSDGWLTVLPYTNRHWSNLYEAAGYANLLDQPWHKDMPTRMHQADKVYAELKTIVGERSTEYWLDTCAAQGIPVAQVAHLRDIVQDPALHRGVLRTLEHPVAGPYRHINSPFIFSRTPVAADPSPAPLLGEQTCEVLSEAGLSAEQVTDAMSVDPGVLAGAAEKAVL